MFIGQSVQTPYGKGLIQEIREDHDKSNHTVIVQPTSWILASGQKPIFYMNPNDVSPLYDIGVVVNTPFGLGHVVKIRHSDGIYVVHLSNWFLATNVSPVMYLNDSALSLIPKSVNVSDDIKPMSEIERTLLKAKEVKLQATIAYNNGDYEDAKEKYVEVLLILRYTTYDMCNEDKAKRLEQTIPCNNNIALCSYQLKNYPDCCVFASNALHLIHKLEESGPDSKIMKALNSIGVSSDEIITKAKRKSLFYLGKSKFAMGEYKQSLKYLIEFRNLISLSNEAEINRVEELIRKTSRCLKRENDKERSTWSKAFKRNQEESETLQYESISEMSTPAATPQKSDMLFHSSLPQSPSQSPPQSPFKSSSQSQNNRKELKQTNGSVDNKKISLDSSEVSKVKHGNEGKKVKNGLEVSSSSASIITKVVLIASVTAIISFVVFKSRLFRK